MKVFRIEGDLFDIEHRFHRNLDPSLVLQSVRNPKTLKLLGKGFHFHTYLLNMRDFSYGLSIARNGIWDGEGHRLDQWFQGLEMLSTIDHPLIPPIVSGNVEEQIYYITPYCNQNLTLSKNSLGKELANLEAKLDQRGLWVDDYWQVKSLEGQPFVIDWSDLRMR